MENQSFDRRKYYRIDDEVMMSYQLIEEDEPSVLCLEPNDNTLTPFGLINYLRRTTENNRAILNRIEQKDAELAQYLKMIDEKIENLSRLFLVEKTDIKDRTPQTVNISAGGLGFYTDEPLKEGIWIEIRLIMCPSLLGIHTFGRVIRCENLTPKDNETESYYIGVEFQKLRDSDRDFLTGHILRKQSMLIRNARDHSERP